MEEKSLQRQGGVTKGVHKVYLNARKSAVMSGVKDVLSFDAKGHQCSSQELFLSRHPLSQS